MDDEREKKSFSEMDRERNRSAHTSNQKDRDRKSKNVEKRGEALAKKALDDLFKPKKTKEQTEAWKKVKTAKSHAFPAAAEEYVAAHGYPPEWDDLLRLLDHPKESFAMKTLDQMMTLVENQTAPARDLLVGKLRILKLTIEDEKHLQKIEAAAKELES